MAEVATPPARRALSRRRKLLFALVPLVVLFGIGEAFARSFRQSKGHSPFMTGSYRDQRIDLIRRGFPAAHDPLLGYVPRPGFASDENQWRAMVSIDAQTMRRNGRPRPAGDRVTLAVGDSFTFGDQVADGDTWPAQLERLLARPVQNGGVFGYSFAQTVLRAEQLLAQPSVDCVVCSFIPDDLKRCELSKRFTPTPWFDLVDGELALRGVPVPDSATANTMDSQYVQKALGHSALLDVLFWNTMPSWWVAESREVIAHPPGTGLVLGKKLVERLAKACTAKGARLLLVLQGPAPEMPAGPPVHAPELLEHARRLGIATLDLATRFRAMADADRTLDAKFFAGHMTAAGNLWVAEQVAAELRTGR